MVPHKTRNASPGKTVAVRETLVLGVCVLVVLILVWMALRSSIDQAADERLGDLLRDARAEARLFAESNAHDYLRTVLQQNRAIIENLLSRAQSGEIPADEARKRAAVILQSQRIGEQGGLYALDSDGRVVVPPRSDSFLPRAVPRLGVELVQPELHEGYTETVWRNIGETDGQRVAMYMTYLESWDWAIIAVCHHENLPLMQRIEDLGKSAPFAPDTDGVHAFVLSSAGGAVLFPDLHPENLKNLEARIDAVGWNREDRLRLDSVDWQRADGTETRPRDLVIASLPEMEWLVGVAAPAGHLPGGLYRVRSWSVGGLLLLALTVLAGMGWVFTLSARRIRMSEEEIDHLIEERAKERTVSLDSSILRLERELAEKEKVEARLSETNRDLSAWLDDIKQSSREIQLLNRMGDLLQACRTVEETDGVIAQLAGELFPNDAGYLSRYNDEQNMLETVITWGNAETGDAGDFLVDDCWALRQGKVYTVRDSERELVCGHLDPARPEQGYMCVPMMAQGELLGLLHLQWGAPESVLSEEALRGRMESRYRLATTVTEQFALALANLKLREMLRAQSIRDQLTGLYNRRHMEESVAREIHRAKRSQKPLGIMMIDVDHFKRFNDTYGHEDGDIVLREMGALLSANIRQEDIACRYGGEEFLVILPEAPLDIARERAELLRDKVRSGLRLKQQPVTISVGVAVLSEERKTTETLVAAADQALYQAKEQGRDCVVVWEECG